MSNSLTTYQENGPLDLVAVRLDSQRFPRLKTLPVPAAVTGVAQIITGALAYTGRKLPEEDVRYMAQSLYGELIQDYDGIGTANITLEELRYCIRRAVLGLGPEMYGINVASLYKIACDYCTNEGRVAQESANNRHAAQRRKELKTSAAGAMLDSYAGQILLNTHTK